MSSLLRTVAAVGLLAAVFACRTAVVGAGESGEHGSITWLNSLDQAKKTAKEEKKIILIDFSADWCTPCKQMLATTYKDREVAKGAKRFVPVLIDADGQSLIARKYKVDALPTAIFLDRKGKELLRSTGFQSKDDFLALMGEALKKEKS
jgi:thiol:disulfide interchange protein DsbD